MNLKRIYKQCNKRFFSGILPNKGVKVKFFAKAMAHGWKTIDLHGLCVWECDNNKFTIYLHKDDPNLIGTLLHEMIHVEQAIMGRDLDHGWFFTTRSKKIEKESGFEVL